MTNDMPVYCLYFDSSIESMLNDVPGIPVINLSPGSNITSCIARTYPTKISQRARLFSISAVCDVDSNIDQGVRLRSLFIAAQRETVQSTQTTTLIQRIIIYIVNRLFVIMFQLKQAKVDINQLNLDHFRLLSLIMKGLSKFNGNHKSELSAHATCENLLSSSNDSVEARFIRNIIQPNNTRTGFVLNFRNRQDCYDLIRRFKLSPTTIKDSCVLYLWPTQPIQSVSLIDSTSSLKVTQLTKLHTTLLHQLDADEPIDTTKLFCHSDIGLDQTLTRVMDYFKARAIQGRLVDSFRVLGKVEDLLYQGITNQHMSGPSIQAKILQSFASRCMFATDNVQVQLKEIATSQPFNTNIISPSCVLDLTFVSRNWNILPPQPLNRLQFHPLSNSHLQLSQP